MDNTFKRVFNIGQEEKVSSTTHTAPHKDDVINLKKKIEELQTRNQDMRIFKNQKLSYTNNNSVRENSINDTINENAKLSDYRNQELYLRQSVEELRHLNSKLKLSLEKESLNKKTFITLFFIIVFLQPALFLILKHIYL
jgi:hypothetical protein